MLDTTAETMTADLRDYGEDATANALLSRTDEELVRVCSVAEWILHEGDLRELA